MSGPDVRQALRHPPRVQDARQVCAQRHGADAPCSRSEGKLHLQGMLKAFDLAG